MCEHAFCFYLKGVFDTYSTEDAINSLVHMHISNRGEFFIFMSCKPTKNFSRGQKVFAKKNGIPMTFD